MNKLIILSKHIFDKFKALHKYKNNQKNVLKNTFLHFAKHYNFKVLMTK